MVASGLWEVAVLEAGQVVDRYEVLAFVGEGGMAMVFHVRHRVLQSDHALKVITNIHPSFQDRLLREGRAQAGLRHPNVVRVTDVVKVGDSIGLVMDWVAGPTLRSWLEYHSPTMDEALELFRGVVRGVRHAHHNSIVHRDLKPSNVLVAETDSGPVPQVADFGLAKAGMEESDAQEGVYSLWDDRQPLTKTGAALGTPEYMSPEQIRDSARVDHRADLFSLGCILYELVCGRQAFQGDVVDVYNAVTTGEFRSPAELVPDAPPAVIEAIDRLLTVDPRDRMTSCDELLRLLDPPAPEAPAPVEVPVAVVTRPPSPMAVAGPMLGLVAVAAVLGWLVPW